ncbi:MAG TPA: type II secretion system secretin GspD [Steroidobacteraceae bacterium]|jgi:general secretion pathway protein D|nr:type II secretion system secretin GspD [Steroidobacteraceae bacterium]
MSDRVLTVRPHARRNRIALAVGLLTVSACALSQQTASDAPGTRATGCSAPCVTPNFKDADITQIIEAVRNVTGKTFIIDPRVRAQVTMLSSTPMTPSQFYEAFLSILQVHAFMAVPGPGNVVKILPDTNMRQYPSLDLPDRVSGTSDEVVTQVLAVKNVSAAQLVPVLRPLAAQNAQLSAVTGANILIISDHSSNVNRIMRIIERIDQVGNPDYDVITLHSATAADTARVLNSLLAQSGEAAGMIKIVADDRSNSILLSGDETTRLRVKTLIAHLDTPIDAGSETQVRYLRFSDAEDLATRLKEQLSGTSSGGSSSSSLGSNVRNVPYQPTPNSQGNTGPLPNPNASSASSGPATLTLKGETATIWADKATNALVITAGARGMRALNAVIDKLDIRRPQVYVEAIIAEVTVDKTSDLGVNWALDGTNSSVGVGGFVSPIGGTSIVDLANAALGATATSSSINGTTTTSPGVSAAGLSNQTLNGTTFGVGRLRASGVNFAAVVRALQSDSRTNILGTPSVVTRDNQEAKMEVAQEVPFLTGQYSTTNGTGSAFQTIQREDIGTILTVTPTINEGNTVLLKLQVESSSLAASASGAVDLITNKNSITTSVLVKDGGTLVLGGLIQDSVTNSESQVPILGSIPILGELFRTRNTSKTKTNFLIFLQPHILRSDEQASEETDAKFNYIRDQQTILNRDKKIIPFQPFAPADPLPSISEGRTKGGILSPDANTAPPPSSTASPAPSAPGTPLAPDSSQPPAAPPSQTPAVTSPDNSQSAGPAK